MFGEHAGYIIPAYLISFLALSAMVLIIRHQYKNRLAELKSLEQQGAKRRSDKVTLHE